MVNEKIEFIKDFFSNNLSNYKIERIDSHGPYWYISFVLDEIKIIIDGDIGFGITIELYDSKYELWQYDKSVVNAMKTNKENILYQLNVLKSFLIN
jgi:hypothetical protein